MPISNSPIPRVREAGSRVLALRTTLTILGYDLAMVDLALKTIRDDRNGRQIFPDGNASSESKLQSEFETNTSFLEQALTLYETALASQISTMSGGGGGGVMMYGYFVTQGGTNLLLPAFLAGPLQTFVPGTDWGANPVVAVPPFPGSGYQPLCGGPPGPGDVINLAPGLANASFVPTGSQPLNSYQIGLDVNLVGPTTTLFTFQWKGIPGVMFIEVQEAPN